MNSATRIVLGALILVGLAGLPSCGSATRIGRPQALTGQSDLHTQSDADTQPAPRARPRPGGMQSKGLHGPP